MRFVFLIFLIPSLLVINSEANLMDRIDDTLNSFEITLNSFLDGLHSNGVSTSTTNAVYCAFCNTIFAELIPPIRTFGYPGELFQQNSSQYDSDLKLDINEQLLPVCKLFYPEDVCVGLLELNEDIFFYIIRQRPFMTTSQMCSIMFQSNDCLAVLPLPNWNVAVSPGPQKPKKIGTGDKFTILHITDPHIDHQYLEGGLAECGKPMCCQTDSGAITNASQTAGFWGDYRDCDTPWRTWETMLDQIVQLIGPFGEIGPVKYIYMTGDIINHRFWNTNASGIISDVNKLLKTLHDSFPGIKVVPILGNHEAHPCNVFAENVPDPRFSLNWLYDDIAEVYINQLKWLPNDPDIWRTLQRGGYYTYLIETGLRIVGLNSNVCYTNNWWLLYNQEDPYDQLAWLNQVLKKAEENGEQVHILSHIPSGDNTCLINWARNYAAIIDRYSNIVRAMWSGHTHKSELRVYYNHDTINPKPTVVNYVGGSVTTFSYFNPNFRTFDINSYDFDVVDFTEYSFDLAAANANPDLSTPPKWEKLYSFTEKYGLADCSAASVDGLLYKMSTDATVLNTYLQLTGRNSVAFNSQLESCDAKCKKAAVCECAVTVYRDNRRCTQLTANMV